MGGSLLTIIQIGTGFLSKRNSAKLFFTFLFLSEYFFQKFDCSLVHSSAEAGPPRKPIGMLVVWSTLTGPRLRPGIDIVGTSKLIPIILVKIVVRKVRGLCFKFYVFFLPPSSQHSQHWSKCVQK